MPHWEAINEVLVMSAQTSARGGQVNAEIQDWGAAQERFHNLV